MRNTCLFCVSKHLAKASVLIAEACQGYPMHVWYAIGNLSEAEDEAVSEHPDLALKIRSVRLSLMGQVQDDDTMRPFSHSDIPELIAATRAIAAEKNGVDEETRILQILFPSHSISKDTAVPLSVKEE